MGRGSTLLLAGAALRPDALGTCTPTRTASGSPAGPQPAAGAGRTGPTGSLRTSRPRCDVLPHLRRCVLLRGWRGAGDPCPGAPGRTRTRSAGCAPSVPRALLHLAISAFDGLHWDTGAQRMAVVIDSFGCFHSPLHGKRLHFATRRRRPSARCNSALSSGTPPAQNELPRSLMRGSWPPPVGRRGVPRQWRSRRCGR